METMRNILCIVSVMATLIELCTAVGHNVGDTTGWDTASDIKKWASTKKFQVGDNLVFKYSSPMHNVVEVTKSDYDSCQSTNAIETHTGGSTTVPLKSPGKRFFICATAGHCDMGMKLEVDTLALSAASPPPPKAALPPSAPKSDRAGIPPSSTPKSIGSLPPSSSPEGAAPTGSWPPLISPGTTPPPSVMDVPTVSPISPSASRSLAPSPVQSASPARGGLGAGLVVGWFVAIVMVLVF